MGTTGLGQWPWSWKVDIEGDHGGCNDRPTLSDPGRPPPPNGRPTSWYPSTLLPTRLSEHAADHSGLSPGLGSVTSTALAMPLGGSSAPHRTAPATAAQAQRSSTECGTLHAARSRKDGCPSPHLAHCQRGSCPGNSAVKAAEGGKLDVQGTQDGEGPEEACPCKGPPSRQGLRQRLLIRSEPEGLRGGTSHRCHSLRGDLLACGLPSPDNPQAAQTRGPHVVPQEWHKSFPKQHLTP